MTKRELRNHPEYRAALDKIMNYSAGFKFTIPYWKIPKPQANALKIVLHDACEAGLLESVSMDYDLDMNLTDETFIRTHFGIAEVR